MMHSIEFPSKFSHGHSEDDNRVNNRQWLLYGTYTGCKHSNQHDNLYYWLRCQENNSRADLKWNIDTSACIRCLANNEWKAISNIIFKGSKTHLIEISWKWVTMDPILKTFATLEKHCILLVFYKDQTMGSLDQIYRSWNGSGRIVAASIKIFNIDNIPCIHVCLSFTTCIIEPE